MNLTRKEISEKFLKYEKDHNLLYLVIDKVMPWQISRVWLFLSIYESFSPKKNSPPKKIREKIMKIQRIIFNSIFNNPFIDLKKSETLVFQSSRKYLVDHTYIDIYTQYLIDKLRNQHQKVTVYETFVENADNPLSFLGILQNKRHLDFINIISKFLKKFVKTDFSIAEFEVSKKIEADLKKEFFFEANISFFFKETIKQFKAEYLLYDLLFRLKRPNEIFIINSCDKSALVYAAKKNNIIVNELQHGYSSDKDLISNYPYTEEESLAYFPNRYYIWDNVDMFFAKLPLKRANILKIPHYHLENLILKTANIEKNKACILIISQPHDTGKLQDIIVNNKDDIKDYEIIYKKHPVENETAYTNFKNKFVEDKNIKFIDNEESVYVFLKKAHYVIGIASAALFEAVAFDCRIILLNLPGVEMSFPLLKNSNCKLIDGDDRLINFLTEEI